MDKTSKTLSLSFILLSAFINYMGIGLIYPIFASMLFDTSLSFVSPDASNVYRGFVLGVLLALMPLMQFFFSPYLGKYSDRIGRKKVLVFCLALCSTSYVVALYGVMAESLPALIVFRVLLGIAGSSVAIVQAILIDLSQEKKARNLSLFNMAMGAGYAIGPFIGGYFSEISLFSGTFTLPFVFALLLTIANLYLVYQYLEETKTPSIIEKAATKLTFSFGTKVKRLLVCMFVFAFGWSFFFEFLPIFLMGQYHFTPSQIGNFYGYSGLIYTVSSAFLIRPVIEKVKADPLLITSFLLCGCYIFFLSSITSSTALWMYIPVLIYLVAIIFPTISYRLSSLTDPKKQGEALGALIAFQSLAFAISPLFSGFLVGFHHATPVFLAAFSFILAGVISFYYYFKKQESGEVAPAPIVIPKSEEES
jgi:DHA1 family tetracycline resistance protein-like MFS transporter